MVKDPAVISLAGSSKRIFFFRPPVAMPRRRRSREDLQASLRRRLWRWRPRDLNRSHTFIASLKVKNFVSAAGRAIRLDNAVRRDDSRHEEHRVILVLPDQNRIAVVDPCVLKLVARETMLYTISLPNGQVLGRKLAALVQIRLRRDGDRRARTPE